MNQSWRSSQPDDGHKRQRYSDIYIYVYVPRTCRASYRVEKKSAAARQAAVRDSHPEVGGLKSRCKPDLLSSGSYSTLGRLAPDAHRPLGAYLTLGSPKND